MTIPLYNCYWCKCAWCAYGYVCEDKMCKQCKGIDKKGKIPYLMENCQKYLPETPNNEWLVKMVQKCDNCKYKRILRLVLKSLEKDSP